MASGDDQLAAIKWARGLSRDRENGLGWKAIAVARTLADHADGNLVCSVLQSTIAAESRMSDRAVRDGLTELLTAGLVESRRTRGASVFLLKSGTTCRSSPAPRAALVAGDRHDTPIRPAPRADRRNPPKEKQEVNLSKGSNENASASGADEDDLSSDLSGGNDTTQTRHSLIAPPSAPPEVQALAHRVYVILDGGFGGLMEPASDWKRPTAYAVERVLERHGRPGHFLVERAAMEARRTMQQREDGRNCVALFEHKLKTEVAKAAGLHEKLVAEFGATA